MKNMIKNLKTLTDIDGTSGDETRVFNAILKMIKNKFTSYETDALGNLIVFKKGKKKPDGNIMVAAHMDEVGFMVTSVDESGLLNFATVGGMDPRTLYSARIRLRNHKTDEIIYGSIAYKSIHLEKERGKVPDISEFKIDIGAKDKKEAEKTVYTGMRGTFDSEYVNFGDGKIKAKALDDRVGCAVMVEIICKDELEVDTYFAFTTREEIGCLGAKTASHRIKPRYGLVLEGTACADIGDTPVGKEVCIQKKGPAISFMDLGAIYSRELFDLAFSLADKENIVIQPKTRVSAQNDSKIIQTSGAGADVLAISLPCRYIHSASSVIDEHDFFETKKIVSALLKKIGV